MTGSENTISFNGMSVYLSGPIDAAPDKGIGWREELTPPLLQLGFSDVLNPCEKPVYLKKLLQLPPGKTEFDMIVKLSKEQKWQEAEDLIAKVIHVDLRCVDKSDVLIGKVDTKIPMCGTMHEIVLSEGQRKPLFVICDGGVARVHKWLIGLVGFRNIFPSGGALIENLWQIKMGTVEPDRSRWLSWR